MEYYSAVKKEHPTDLYKNLDESQKHYVDQNKSDTRVHSVRFHLRDVLEQEKWGPGDRDENDVCLWEWERVSWKGTLWNFLEWGQCSVWCFTWLLHRCVQWSKPSELDTPGLSILLYENNTYQKPISLSPFLFLSLQFLKVTFRGSINFTIVELF